MAEKNENTIYKGIFGAFMILLMHVALLGFIGILILFFHGIINYIGWIIIGLTFSVIAWWYWFYRRTKKHATVIKDMVEESVLKGKTVEVSFLGGAATFKIGDSRTLKLEGKGPSNSPDQLEGPKPGNVDNLTELARLYEKKLITAEEFEKAKKEILNK